MKRLFYITMPLIVGAMALVSCSKDDEPWGNTEGLGMTVNIDMEDYIQMAAETSDDAEDVSDAPRRIKYVVKGTAVDVIWGGPTSIGIFPINPVNSQIRFDFTPKEDDQIAVFTGQGWGIQEGVQYYAYYPYHNLTSNDRYDSIPISFAGQHQVGNNSFTHIGNHYDYMYSDSTLAAKGVCAFHFKHISSLEHFRIVVPVAGDWESLTVSTQGGEDSFVEEAVMNVRTGEVTPTKRASSFTVTLDSVVTHAPGDTVFVNTAQLPTTLGPITMCLKSRDGSCFYSNFGKGKIVEWRAGEMRPYPCKPKTENMLDVNLGLPSGNLWASCNLGATQPNQMGNYLAWGETESRERYFWDTYKYSQLSDGSYGTSNAYINKYTIDDKFYDGTWYNQGVFQGDNLVELELSDDPSRLLWGGTWVTPTKADYEELMQNCTAVWDTLDVAGYRLVSKINGNSIFFPAAGWRGLQYLHDTQTDVQGLGEGGYYWTSTLDPSYSFDALEFKFGKQTIGKQTIYMEPSLTGAKRYIGCSVRAIKPGKNRK